MPPDSPGPESPAPEPHPGPGSTQSRRERDSGRERDRTKIQHEPGTAPRTERPATARKHGPPRAPTARPGTPAEGATDRPRSPDPGPRANEPRAAATADAELIPQRGLGPPPPQDRERSTGEGTKYTGHRCPELCRNSRAQASPSEQQMSQGTGRGNCGSGSASEQARRRRSRAAGKRASTRLRATLGHAPALTPKRWGTVPARSAAGSEATKGAARKRATERA